MGDAGRLRTAAGVGGCGHVAGSAGGRARGIGVQVHYIPVHQQPFYQNLGFKIGDYPNAESFYAAAISLPMFPTLSDDDQMQVVDIVRDILTAG